MDKQQPTRKKKASKSEPRTRKPLEQPDVGSPMDKFNKALRKILSVSKKNLKDK